MLEQQSELKLVLDNTLEVDKLLLVLVVVVLVLVLNSLRLYILYILFEVPHNKYIYVAVVCIFVHIP
jgi:hypothetical protein